MVCTHCERADLSKTHAPCLADAKRRYIGDIAQAGDCPENKYPLSGTQKLFHGAAGVGSAILRAGRPIESAIRRRTALCNSCDHAVMQLGAVRQCRLCGCATWAKIRNASEHCPIGRWGPAFENICVVQIARAGDILSLLPALRRLRLNGQRVYHVVCREYLPMVRGLSYLDPIAYDGSHDSPAEAAKLASELDAEVVISQGWGNRNPVHADNFIIEPWVRLGMAEYFETEPLILDNRNSEAEWNLYKKTVGDERRPLLLLNLKSNRQAPSSPYPDANTLLDWVESRWGERCRIVRLSEIWANRFQDLLGIYERAAALISCDTGTLHLGYATLTPTVGLVNDQHARASVRRPHWIERMTYSESRMDEGRERIAVAVEKELAKRNWR